MKRAWRHTFSIVGAAAIGGVALIVFFSPKSALPVKVTFYATTNDSSGNTLQCFQITNNMAEDTHGYYAVEVFHKGVWFNALPQPKGAGDLAYLPARGFTYFSVATPTGRAEEGLVVQSSPPGEKWRTYFSYDASRYPPNFFGRIMERLSNSIGSKTRTKALYAFSPEMPFEAANKPYAADPR